MNIYLVKIFQTLASFIKYTVAQEKVHNSNKNNSIFKYEKATAIRSIHEAIFLY